MKKYLSPIKNIDFKLFYSLFENIDDSSILSVLEGKFGNLYADSETSPQSAVAKIGDFNYIVGVPCNIENLKSIIGQVTVETILIFDKQEWKSYIKSEFKLIEFYRYATKPPKEFDIKKLEELSGRINQLNGYTLSLMNEDDYNSLKTNSFGKDLTGNAPNYQAFSSNCLGVLAKYKGETVAGTSSYTYYSKGIEIQVETDKKHGGKGLATICSSVFILECIKRGLTPHWDAAHLTSLHIANKLGFVSQGEYKAYHINTKTED